MYARVATFEGGTEEALRAVSKEISESDGPPPGIPSKGITILIDPASGRSMAIALFETEEDYRQGDETLSSMNPPSGETCSRRRCGSRPSSRGSRLVTN